MAKKLTFNIETHEGVQSVAGSVASTNFAIYKPKEGALKGRYSLTHLASGRSLGYFSKASVATACAQNLEQGLPGLWEERRPLGKLTPQQAGAVGGYLAQCFCYDEVHEFKEFVQREYPHVYPTFTKYWSN